MGRWSDQLGPGANPFEIWQAARTDAHADLDINEFDEWRESPQTLALEARAKEYLESIRADALQAQAQAQHPLAQPTSQTTHHGQQAGDAEEKATPQQETGAEGTSSNQAQGDSTGRANNLGDRAEGGAAILTDPALATKGGGAGAPTRAVVQGTSTSQEQGNVIGSLTNLEEAVDSGATATTEPPLPADHATSRAASMAAEASSINQILGDSMDRVSNLRVRVGGDATAATDSPCSPWNAISRAARVPASSQSRLDFDIQTGTQALEYYHKHEAELQRARGYLTGNNSDGARISSERSTSSSSAARERQRRSQAPSPPPYRSSSPDPADNADDADDELDSQAPDEDDQDTEMQDTSEDPHMKAEGSNDEGAVHLTGANNGDASAAAGIHSASTAQAQEELRQWLREIEQACNDFQEDLSEERRSG